MLASVWVLLLVVVVYASAAATESLYPTVADRVSAAEAINGSPAIVALYGPILDVTSAGELAMTKLTVLYAVFVALLFLVLVRRHTRTEEESGRAELLGGTAVGRDAQLAAAVLESVLVALALGVLAAVACVAGGLPVTGLGRLRRVVGRRLVGGHRRHRGGLPAVGERAHLRRPRWGGPRLLLPAAGGRRHRPRLDLVALAVRLVHPAERVVRPALVGAAARPRRWGWCWCSPPSGCSQVRDLGSGLVDARPGPAVGSPRLADAFALTWRVHRTMVWSWTAGAAAMGLVMGAIAPGVGDLLDTEAGRRVIESIGGVGRLQDALVAAVLSIAAVVVTCFAVAVIGHGAGDERDGRTEQVLATTMSRSRTFLATAAIALGGATWLLLVTGVGAALGLGLQAGDGAGELGRFVGAAVAQSPAVWAVAALALLLYAAGSRYAVLGWAALAGFFALGQLGELLELPGAVTGLSPYTHLPAMPVEHFAASPALILSALAAALTAAAWWRFRERDIR